MLKREMHLLVFSRTSIRAKELNRNNGRLGPSACYNLHK